MMHPRIPAASGDGALGRAGKINGLTNAAALLVEEPRVRLATINGHKARDGVSRPPEWRKRGRTENLAAAGGRMNQHLAMVSHELRNSLYAIRFATCTLGTNQREPPVVKKARLIIERQAGEMARLLDDLLEVLSSRSGRLSLQRKRVDLRVVARHAVESVEWGIGQRNHRLRVALPQAPVWLHADPGRLGQVLVNLLGNAAKYTDSGGELQLCVEHEPGWATVRVRDSGIGIAPDVLPHVFEPFMQAQSSLTHSELGIGIGLAVVRGLVESHGGRVTAASAGLGHGSEFTVHLPAIRARRSRLVIPQDQPHAVSLSVVD